MNLGRGEEGQRKYCSLAGLEFVGAVEFIAEFGGAKIFAQVGEALHSRAWRAAATFSVLVRAMSRHIE